LGLNSPLLDVDLKFPEHQINHNLFEIENDNGPPYKIINKDQKKEK
jgi:hypothetical protein